MPASVSVESWRVNIVRSLARTPPMAKDLLRTRLVRVPRAVGADFFSVTLVGHRFMARTLASASSVSRASTVSTIVLLPSTFIASYSKTGIFHPPYGRGHPEALLVVGHMVFKTQALSSQRRSFMHPALCGKGSAVSIGNPPADSHPVRPRGPEKALPAPAGVSLITTMSCLKAVLGSGITALGAGALHIPGKALQ